ncbi:MAG TPA: pyridoxal phosphate-dependent aminotransferase [Streptosporangiaceae bacterium]|nr:pyridoxal phosphate-dependent aminotransferase [Streptosporangiaceae bacterium]
MPWAGPVTTTATSTAPAPLLTRRTGVPVSATLAANEILDTRRLRGLPVLPLAFGEAGLPVHPRLREELAAASGQGGYGPVAGIPALREAVAGYWTRRGLPTGPGAVVAGPGSKPLLFAVLMAIGTDVAVPRPSWVSYAAQARLIGVTPHFVPAVPGEGGICDPAALEAVVVAAAAAGRPIRSVVTTIPDNPTGRLASPAAVEALAAVAARHDLIIISDEIYRDLVHDPGAAFLSPAAVAPDRTVITTALSKSLALGGWRIGAARLPEGPLGQAITERLRGVGSEIWSAPAVPVQQAAAVGFREPPEIAKRIAQSRSLHATVVRAVAGLCRAAGLSVPAPQAAFYLYPDFSAWRQPLARRGIVTGADLASCLVERYGAGTLPASAFGERPEDLRLRLATGLLYGDTDEQREAALAAPDPLALPWIAAALAGIEDMLADLSP